ncbi:cytochrome c [Acetobacter sp. TBRC 12305]|uniref:Cytochrome c n=1 Tax=Acetobacter garciniae TaxID=2817435 RepID=A0A939HJY6_9PROT|nr:cytochrome c [Acetobacter garciniae]MBO1325813.1 cytochrome c [Acetobacter garciniae]MBX0345713.1 cytochrome c [Acetobacter garciniae]
MRADAPHTAFPFWRNAGYALAVFSVLVLGGCSRKSPKTLYGSNCGICHHGGDGMPGEVPPLVGRLDRIASTAEGRHYLADVLMNGVSGPITANGMRFNAEMPPFRYLPDEDVAAILTWLSQRGQTTPAPEITAADIAQARAVRQSAGKIATERENLDRLHPIP